MIEISQEEAVKHFSQLMESFSSADAKPRSIIEAAANFYRDFRIAGTSVEEDEDMLLFQWGSTIPHLLSYFTDFRPLSDKDVKYESRRFKYIGLTRQIFVRIDEETEFDDSAIGLSAEIYFDEADGNEPSSNFWAQTPDELNNKMQEFLQNPFVENLIDTKPAMVRIFVSYVG